MTLLVSVPLGCAFDTEDFQTALTAKDIKKGDTRESMIHEALCDDALCRFGVQNFNKQRQGLKISKTPMQYS